MKSDEFLRDKGLKITSARIAILELLKEALQPLDVQTIVVGLRKKKIQSDPATVFRTMNAFAEKSIVRQIQLMEGKVRYELTDRDDHHHFICKNCGKIQDISDCNIGELENIIEDKKKVKIQYHALEFYGICGDCLNLAKSKSI